MNRILCFIIVAFVFAACSTGKKSLERGDYNDAINKAITRLGSDPDNAKAIQVLKEGYPLGMTYFQEEIDKFLSGNEPFKWNKALDVMLAVNHISDQIRKVPAARQIVPSPKSYITEIADVQQKAANEYYEAGNYALNQKTRESAKQAYSYFVKANNLVSGYKNCSQLIVQAKDLATLKVIVEQIPVNGRYEYSAQFFYDHVFQMLDYHFQTKDFVNFFSPEQAEKMNLKYPDMILQMGFYDFFIDRPQHFEEQKDLARQVEEKYTVKISRDSTVTRTRMVWKRGKIKIITDQVNSAGLLEVKAIDFQSQNIIFSDKIPGRYTWENKYGIFVGDEQVLDKQLVKILRNKAQIPPESQDMFVLFTQPIFSRLEEKLVNYFNQYN
jgi:hypothetical protein